MIDELRVLLILGSSEDYDRVRNLLQDRALLKRACVVIDQLDGGLDSVSAIVVAESELSTAAEKILPLLASQPGWSDLPILVIAQNDESADTLATPFDGVGKVLVVSGASQGGRLIEELRAVLEGREKQIRLRNHLLNLEEANTELRHSRNQLEIVVKGAQVGVWFCPLPFGELVWDETVKAHFHLPADADITIETLYERMPPDERERHQRAIEESIASGQPFDIDYRTVDPASGSLKWIRALGRCFYDAGGQPSRFDGVTFDVTDRIQAQELLREQSAELETINRVGRSVAAELNLERLVQNVTDATTELTGAEFGAFFYNVVNDRGESYALYTLSGVSREHFAKFPMPRSTDLFGPTFRGEGVVRLDDVLQDPRYGSHAPYHGMPPGHLPVRSYLAVPVTSRNGSVLGGLFFGHSRVGVFSPRTERIVSGVAAQAAVAIDNAHLFDAVQQANAQKDRLLESERAARNEVERTSRIKDEFLATLSHELRTPLNAILGWSHLLRTAAAQFPEELQEGLEIIERNARSQAQIIEDLLDMNRIISGKIRLDVQRLELSPVIQAAIDTVMPAATAKGIRLAPILNPLAGPVSGDPNRLQQIFWNLLSNAVKFTPKGGRIQVLLERVNSHVEVSVVDNGEGIDPAFLPHVFDRFQQADSSTTRQHGGLGLGLAIVKQLVELHGGTVQARSEGPGRGAMFSVQLPMTVIPAEPPLKPDRIAPATSPVPVAVSLRAEIDGLRVVILDDDPDSRGVLKRLVEDCRATVSAASTPDEAIRLIEANPPDIVISDIGMPGEDGYSFIRRVRALPPERGGKTPAIALTAYARAEDRVSAIVAGFQHHLGKPVEPAELMAVIASLARRRI